LLTGGFDPVSFQSLSRRHHDWVDTHLSNPEQPYFTKVARNSGSCLNPKQETAWHNIVRSSRSILSSKSSPRRRSGRSSSLRPKSADLVGQVGPQFRVKSLFARCPQSKGTCPASRSVRLPSETSGPYIICEIMHSKHLSESVLVN
jgi:hypothetical protein